MDLAAEAFAELGRILDEHGFVLEDGCVEHPWFAVTRGKNWVATVEPNRTCPGGLARTFWRPGMRQWYRAPKDLRPGDIVEFAADRFSARGSHYYARIYVMVFSIDVDDEGDGFFLAQKLGSSLPSKRAVCAARLAVGVRVPES